MQLQCLNGGNKPSVFIAIPNMNTISTELVFRLLHWFTNCEHNLYLYAPRNQIPHDRARNICHKQFLTATDCRYIFWIDSDTIPPYNAIDKLLGYDKDIVSLTVPVLHHGNRGTVFEPTALKKMTDGFQTYIGQGLEKVDITTIACTMIKREVMEDVGPGAFDFVEKKDGDGWNIARWGEDLWFGIKYMKAGYQAWQDFSTVCKHNIETNTVAINELMKNVLKRQGGDISG